ncbi:unnamed protein product [Rotaria sordida]|uniref:Uncharacterized protein n=1 Tax=Rotaria sordida TaxID=392033 RepID=A0A814XYV9_9BILA|nr:unnamed protein product [Rotaria sordida]CAF1263051.1 unnamed protein product [Rotaria sordida]CAF1384495.1 unnamed protein product [Rotaria sordida]CAF1423561.1 unnamed protein product [Rotaria sordida]CAF1542805.1 unnamed protein product [Rotaria sordida]
MAGSHKETIEQLMEAINARHVNHLDKSLEDNAVKTANSKTCYTNIQEAREYYSMEHEANPSAQWKLINYQQDNQNNNKGQGTVSHGNHTYDTAYTFSSSGKIQKIEAHLQQQD